MFGGLRRFIFNFREYLTLAVLVIISLSVLSVNDHPWAKNLRVLSLMTFGSVNTAVGNVVSIFGDDDEMKRLKRENAELMLQVNMLREHGIENRELKRMLIFRDTTNFPLVPSKIISKQVSGARGNFVVNAGRNEGILAGMPVINDEGLVGIIDDVTGDYSIVRTLENTLVRIAVENQRSGVYGILVWDGKNALLKNVPSDYDVKIGDRIVTSQFSTKVPPSIPVGLVIDKETKISGVLSNIIVKHFVDFNSIDNVFIMKIIQSSETDSLETNL